MFRLNIIIQKWPLKNSTRKPLHFTFISYNFPQTFFQRLQSENMLFDVCLQNTRTTTSFYTVFHFFYIYLFHNQLSHCVNIFSKKFFSICKILLLSFIHCYFMCDSKVTFWFRSSFFFLFVAWINRLRFATSQVAVWEGSLHTSETTTTITTA